MSDRVLVVDDDKTFRVVSQAALAAEGHEVRVAASASDGLVEARAFQPHVVILDRNLPDADGLELLSRLLAAEGEAPMVVMATAYGEIENAVEAMRRGAFDYLAKPIALPALLVAVRKALEARRVRRRARSLSGESRRRLERAFCPGRSEAMRGAVQLAEKVALSPDTTVLVTGESGTGKELVAQIVHQRTPGRGEGPFVEINCAAIPETLLEAELFGHEKGAFTDAARARAGLLEEAEGGTLFLDEVGDMPLATQAKLLRVLETRTFRRLGGSRDLDADVRFVAATHHDLAEAVARNAFRLDLFHRLDVFRIHLAALRERSDDILPLARFILRELAARAGKAIEGLAPETERLLLEYSFPGNVRELRNVIERAVVLETGRLITPESVLLPVLPPQRATAAALAAAASTHAAPGPAAEDVPPTLAQVEREYLCALLERAGGNKSQVARWMGVSYPTVAKKIQDLGVELTGARRGERK
jgi:DNA-binding NtrC family response regulator